MSDYTKTTDFAAKDALATGNAGKVITGTEHNDEYNAIATAIATKYDAVTDLPEATTLQAGTIELATQAEAEALLDNGRAVTPDTLDDVLNDNAGMVADIQAMTDPGADTLLGWDDSGSTVIGYSAGDGIQTSGGNLNLDIATGTPLEINSAELDFDLTALTNVNGSSLTGADEFIVNVSGTGNRVVSLSEGGFRILSRSTTYTFVDSQFNAVHEITGATDRAWTLNTGAGQTGNFIILVQSGTGSIQINGTATVNSTVGLFTRTQHSVAILLCLSTDVWVMFGDTSAS